MFVSGHTNICRKRICILKGNIHISNSNNNRDHLHCTLGQCSACSKPEPDVVLILYYLLPFPFKTEDGW